MALTTGGGPLDEAHEGLSVAVGEFVIAEQTEPR